MYIRERYREVKRSKVTGAQTLQLGSAWFLLLSNTLKRITIYLERALAGNQPPGINNSSCSDAGFSAPTLKSICLYTVKRACI